MNLFQYQGTREFETRVPVGRMPGERAIGHHFQDYHGNRNMYVRKVGRDTYHVKVYVNAVVTVDHEMTKRGMQSYTINHLGFDMTENLFKLIT